MNHRLPLLLAAAAAVFAFALGASPALAAAKKHHPPTPPSAYDVYTEQVPTAKGSKPVGPGTTSGSSGSYAGQYGNSGKPVSLTPSAQSALQRSGGKDKSLLKTVATNPAFGAQPELAAAGASSAAAPSALGATFSGVGKGPIALLVALLAGAVVLFWLGRVSGRRAERR